jgi:hypothetical protein
MCESKKHHPSNVETSEQSQPLADHWQGEAAGLFGVNGFAGFEAVFLYAIHGERSPVDSGMMLELGDFLNRHSAAAGSASDESSGDFVCGAGLHGDAPIEWQLNNFARYIKDHQIQRDELKFMMDVAIGALAIVNACR